MRLVTVRERFRNHFIVVALVVFGAVIPVGCGDRETILMIEQPTEIHSITEAPASPGSPSASLQPGHVIAMLKAGETAQAVGVYHGQDYDGFKVKLTDGTEVSSWPAIRSKSCPGEACKNNCIQQCTIQDLARNY
jgi:hypothetical protein